MDGGSNTSWLAESQSEDNHNQEENTTLPFWDEADSNRTWLLWGLDDRYKLLKAVTVTSITFTIYVINSLSIYLLSKTWRSRYWQDSVVILALFTTDLLNGVTSFSMSSWASWQLSVLRQPSFVAVHFVFYHFWGAVSLTLLAGASIIQMLAVVRPLHFQQEVTLKKMLLGMMLVGLTAGTVAVSGFTIEGTVVTSPESYLPYQQNHIFNVASVASVYTSCTGIILFCYGRIFLAVLRQKRQLQVTNANCGNFAAATTSQSVVLNAIRSAKKIFIIILLYFVLYLPLLTTSVVDLSWQFYAGLTYFYFLWLQVCNSFCNSVVYIALNSHMREALTEIFRRQGRVQPVSD